MPGMSTKRKSVSAIWLWSKVFKWLWKYCVMKQTFPQGKIISNSHFMRICINLFYGSECAYKKWFNEWQFPKKQSPLSEDQKLVSIICTMWKNNITQSDMIYGLTLQGHMLTIRQLKEVHLHSTVRPLTRRSNTDDPNKNQMKLRAAVESGMSSGHGFSLRTNISGSSPATGWTFRITVNIANILIH